MIVTPPLGNQTTSDGGHDLAPGDFKGSDVCPPNATALERAMADAAWANLTAADVEVVRQVVDPATCPTTLLPWLAWSMSVDSWDDNWAEQTKRDVIAAAPEVHRLKGTRRAVRLALAALGIEFEIVEWWQTQPALRRGKFDVTVFTNDDGPALTQALIVQIRQSIRAAKPKSRIFDVVLGARSTAIAYAGGAQQNVVSVTVQPEAA